MKLNGIQYKQKLKMGLETEKFLIASILSYTTVCIIIELHMNVLCKKFLWVDIERLKQHWTSW